MEAKKNVLTYGGLKKLEDELQFLKVEERKRIAEKIKEAVAQGDLTENAEYDSAKDEQRDIEARIEEITNILKNCYKYSSGAYSTFSNSYGGRVTNVDSSGDITIPFRYSSSYSGTINGTYSVQVYLLDMPSGITIFE